jgi:hypothetical protein
VTVFRVGEHEVRLWRERGRWGVAVDDAVHRGWFMSESQAAGAGLLRANRLDQVARRQKADRPGGLGARRVSSAA